MNLSHPIPTPDNNFPDHLSRRTRASAQYMSFMSIFYVIFFVFKFDAKIRLLSESANTYAKIVVSSLLSPFIRPLGHARSLVVLDFKILKRLRTERSARAGRVRNQCLRFFLKTFAVWSLGQLAGLTLSK